MTERVAVPRIGVFACGAALATSCAIVAWLVFALLTMKMNPALEGEEYWAAVLERMGNNPALCVLLALFCVGASVGVVLMGRAIWGSFENAEAKSAVERGATKR